MAEASTPSAEMPPTGDQPATSSHHQKGEAPQAAGEGAGEPLAADQPAATADSTSAAVVKEEPSTASQPSGNIPAPSKEATPAPTKDKLSSALGTFQTSTGGTKMKSELRSHISGMSGIGKDGLMRRDSKSEMRRRAPNPYVEVLKQLEPEPEPPELDVFDRAEVNWNQVATERRYGAYDPGTSWFNDTMYYPGDAYTDAMTTGPRKTGKQLIVSNLPVSSDGSPRPLSASGGHRSKLTALRENVRSYEESNLLAIHRVLFSMTDSQGKLKLTDFVEYVRSLMAPHADVSFAAAWFERIAVRDQAGGLGDYLECIIALDALFNGSKRESTMFKCFKLADVTNCNFILKGKICELRDNQEETEDLSHLVIGALLNVFKKVAQKEFEDLQKAQSKGKKKKKKDQPVVMPSKRKFHINFEEFSGYVLHDPCILQFFLPYVLKCAVREFEEEDAALLTEELVS